MQTGCLFVGTCLSVATLVAMAGCGNSKGGPDRATATSVGGQDKDQSGGPAPADGKTGANTKSGNRSHPQLKIETSMGNVTVRLDAERAPLTVDNFLQYVDKQQYDGTIFHQVNQGYAVLGGSYGKDMKPRSDGVAVRNEAHNGLKNRRGTIAMARRPDAIDSATRQFFFNLSDNADLDHKDDTAEGYGYCVFGEVVEGMDVLDKIGSVAVHDVPTPDGPPFQAVPVEPVQINLIRRVRR